MQAIVPADRKELAGMVPWQNNVIYSPGAGD